MKLTGSFEIKLDKNSVWKALNNPEILKKCIPGCEEFKKNLISILPQLQQIKLDQLTLVLQEILSFKI